MEVLNRNQRKNALLRILGIGGLLGVLSGLALFSIDRAYDAVGDNTIGEMKAKIDSVYTKMDADSAVFVHEFDSLVEKHAQNTEEFDIAAIRAEIKKLESDLEKQRDGQKIVRESKLKLKEGVQQELAKCIQGG